MKLLATRPQTEVHLIARIARFAVAGGFVAAAYSATTTILSEVLGAPFQLALVIGFAAALTAHFTLQRRFVWVRSDSFALPLRAQLTRYLAVSVLLYGTTALVTAVVPGLVDVPVLAVYFVWTALVSCANFYVLGQRVFHPADGPQSSREAQYTSHRTDEAVKAVRAWRLDERRLR